MKILSIALRNLLRNRRRSMATLLAMIIGLSAILVFGGYSRNSIYAMQTGYVQLHGHLQIQRKDYFLYGSGNPAAYGIADYQRVIVLVKHDPVLAPMLTVVTPKLQLGGIAGNFAAGLSTNVVSAGIVADEQTELKKWDDYGSMIYSPPFALACNSAPRSKWTIAGHLQHHYQARVTMLPKTSPPYPRWRPAAHRSPVRPTSKC